ncbi:MAG: tRNA (N6-isopentenyl adenosine(37)-C2)-methylthiotransferase MiaB [Gemmatimonadetes bacterium]|nr:tRNA (N6-isopentenyl adenosine(37)-C2)-methylthiotransferase MiaB [Gemmatimonadota bacterium]
MNQRQPRRAYVETYGCQMNISDGELMEGLLEGSGYEIVSSVDDADVVLVNTCAIREHAERRVLGRVGQLGGLKRTKPDLVIGVTGCMAQRMGDDLLERAPYVDLVMGPDGYRGLPEALEELDGSRGSRRRLSVLDLTMDENYEGLEQRRRSQVSAWVPIQRGCDHRCTFCIVPYVRGSEKNRDPHHVLTEIQGLADEGITEVTLLGQTVNSYAHGDWSFPRLLRAVARIDGIRRVRYTSPHPNDVSPELIEVMATEEGVCEHVHLPVQSGNDRTLKRMVRRYTVEAFLEKVEMIRTDLPDVALSTDIIVAFPGETEEEFQDTLELVRRVRFDEAFTYRYSPRSGTPATRLPERDFVPDDVGQERLERLISLTRKIQAEINESEVGRVEELLLERSGKHAGTMLGRTRRNKAVVVPGETDLTGRYVTAALTRTTGATFVGERLATGVSLAGTC